MIGILILIIYTVIPKSAGIFAILGANLKKEKIMDYIVYTGQSRLKGEEGCMTIGISRDGFRREYSKIMVITQVLPAQSLAHARAIEKVGIQYMDTVCHRTFVKWCPDELTTSPNRTWDWWIANKSINHQLWYEVLEVMRHRQLNWIHNNNLLLKRRALKNGK